ncbi:MAG: AraC family transcriptional regulator [Suipraeoptans sp.]
MLIEDRRQLPDEFPFDIQRYTETRERSNVCSTSHWHNFLEITCVLDGEVKYYVEGREYHLQSGDIILFNHLESHHWEVISSKLELMVLVFSSRIISDSMNMMDREYLVPFFKRGSNFTNKINGQGEIGSCLWQMIEEICEEKSNENPGYMIMVKADIMRILTLLIRHYQREEHSIDNSKSEKAELNRISDVIEYMKSNYFERITLEDVAAKACMCPNYFSSYFHRKTGNSFQEYLTRIRMDRARNMLRDSNSGITTVAHACGVSNMSNFYRLYKKTYGISPGMDRH